VEERTESGKKIVGGISTGEKPLPVTVIQTEEETRISTGIGELDRVLGGGIVPGSLILIGGDPGIGKSTLLIQISQEVGQAGRVLYVSGEESAKQTKLRANRLGVDNPNVYVVAETRLKTIEEYISEIVPRIVIIDSIQTVFSEELQSAPGSVSQVRDCTARLMRIAKEQDIPIFIVGHVTKEGAIAGPRVLEHMVDTVLYFEGERHHTFRILRGVKNRFGSTNEIGIFEMGDRGLRQVVNPSEIFLTKRNEKVSGSAVVSSMEGTRPVLAELQALVSTTNYGVPRRTVTGVDYNRVALTIAVLEKRIGLGLGNQDIFVNVVGGIKIDEPAADLGVALSIVSSYRDLPIPAGTVIIGELGLTGEIRPVSRIEARVKEAEKLGFNKVIIPADNQGRFGKTEVSVAGVRNISEAMEEVF
jgi:DNA repair protein RadA/Sms